MTAQVAQHDSIEPTPLRRILMMVALVVAGEAVFFLPFVFPRVFRPTILEVFNLSNTELGEAFACYGLVAMAAYALGGPLADLFSPRRLLAIALVSTAVGGVVLWCIPSLQTLKWIYGYWGFTTIALFWSALIRATREWGGQFSQGAAFGLLDGGRGLFAAATGSVLVAIYASLLPYQIESASLATRTVALKRVILVIVIITVGAAMLTVLFLPKHTPAAAANRPKMTLRGMLHIATMPVVWLQAIIIICAYVGYKATDDFSLYAKEVLHVNEVEAAKIGTYSLWMRPPAAIAAGFLADRFSVTKITIASFLLLIAGSAVLATPTMTGSMYVPYMLTVVCASLGICALRGLYYAVMEEIHVPLAFTGSAVGLVSVIGYTPDVFMGPAMGYLLDRSPGAGGHRDVFLMVAAFAVVGLIATVMLIRFNRPQTSIDSDL